MEIDKINNDIINIRKLNIKIDIVNNHIKNLLEKTNIFIRGFGKINIDKTINEITNNLEDLYIRRDEYKQEIADIECSYEEYYKNRFCKNIYECKYYIEKEKREGTI
jgi:hypothetical protein